MAGVEVLQGSGLEGRLEEGLRLRDLGRIRRGESEVGLQLLAPLGQVLGVGIGAGADRGRQIRQADRPSGGDRKSGRGAGLAWPDSPLFGEQDQRTIRKWPLFSSSRGPRLCSSACPMWGPIFRKTWPPR